MSLIWQLTARHYTIRTTTRYVMKYQVGIGIYSNISQYQDNIDTGSHQSRLRNLISYIIAFCRIIWVRSGMDMGKLFRADEMNIFTIKLRLCLSF